MPATTRCEMATITPHKEQNFLDKKTPSIHTMFCKYVEMQLQVSFEKHTDDWRCGTIQADVTTRQNKYVGFKFLETLRHAMKRYRTMTIGNGMMSWCISWNAISCWAEKF